MSKPADILRLEITCVYAGVANGDLLLGDSRAGTVQFHVGKTARRAIRRLRKMGLNIHFPNYTKPPRNRE